jgi:integrase
MGISTAIPAYIKDNKERGVRDSTIEHWQRYVTGYYVKPLHNYPIDELTRVLIQTQIDIIAKQSGKRTAKACKTALGVFFNWALDKGYLPEDHPNPMPRVKVPEQSKPRKRVLTNDEIRQIWKACDALETELKEIKAGTRTRKGHVSNIASPHATKLAFLTGLRRQNIGELKWSEVDLNNAELRIPAERMKNNRELCCPLSKWAVEILRNYKRRPGDDYVFPANYGGNRKLDDTTTQINRRIVNAGGVPPENWTFHDIRRTFRTRLAALGVTSGVAEGLLGHVTPKESPMEPVYNRHEYWPEKRNAVTMWETNLRAIIAGTAEKIVRPQFGQPKKGGAA